MTPLPFYGMHIAPHTETIEELGEHPHQDAPKEEVEENRDEIN